MSITKERVLAALSTVQDPDLKQDLVTLGMIDKLQVHEKTISFVVVLTTPACPLKEYLRQECVRALETAFGEGLDLDIHMSARVTSTRSNAPLLPNVKNIIAVASGKGGVGKSTVTANLAVALAKTGAKVGVVDADIFGPSQHIMFNCEHEQPGIEQEQGKSYIIPIEQYGVKLISIGLLTPADHAIVWRGPMASQALKQFLGEARWGELDYLLIDLPPGTSDIHLTLVQTVPVTGAVVVTTPQKVALADARKALAMFKQPQINVPILGIVENMAYFTPEELPENKYYIFGREGGHQLAEKYAVPFLGEVPLVQSIRESGDSGYPAVLKNDASAGAFQSIAETLARQIAIRNANVEKTQVVDVQ